MSEWLNCKVAKGMFSDEYTVIVRTRSGENVAVFVPKEAAQEGNGRVRVKASKSAGHVIAVLPDASQSVVDVDASELTLA